jgi:transcriptional regulator with XRE-family HTH domain
VFLSWLKRYAPAKLPPGNQTGECIMEMKINSQKIRQLREARGWSQEHLAEVAGLSARTVQRIESDGNIAPESRMALAAALGVEAASLGLTPPTSPMSAAHESAAHENASGASRWRRHALIFVLVCSGLLLFDFMRHGSITWSKWPLFGWGIGLFLHAVGRGRHSGR